MANYPVGNPSGWLSILNRLGITQFGRWLLNDTIVPVALVDSSIAITAIASTALYGAPASAGELVGPAANTRLADTGALAAGNYGVMLWSSSDEAGGAWLRLRRRNAADAADVWSMRYVAGSTAGGFVQMAGRFSILAGERLVVENPLAATAGKVYQACIFATPVA